MVRFDCPAYNGFIQYLCKIAKPRGGAKYIERPQIRSTGENAFDLRAGKLIKNLFGQLVKDGILSTVSTSSATEGNTPYKLETTRFNASDYSSRPKSTYTSSWIASFMQGIRRSPAVKEAMEDLEAFLLIRSRTDHTSQTIDSNQPDSEHSYLTPLCPKIDKPQTRLFLAASPVTPRTSLKRPRSTSDASSSPVRDGSSSPTRHSTPSSSPQSSQSLVLESNDRSKKLRIDDTIVVGPPEKPVGCGKQADNLDKADEGDVDGENSLLDYILGRLEPIPGLQTVSELLQDEMDTISTSYRAQDSRFKLLEENLQKTSERSKLKLNNLQKECTSQHDELIKSLDADRNNQSEVFAKLEGTLAKVETKLGTVEETVNKEILNARIDKQCQSLATSSGNTTSYDKLKARCRKLEDRFITLQQSTTSEERKHRLLEGNTKYTRQLNESVNSWKAQCDKEHTEAKLLKEQMQALEKRSSAMEKMLQDQQRLIEALSARIPHQRDTGTVFETPLKEFWLS
ncbi:hypothetical protein V8E51_010701 [Hyaloscypha variabilis]